MITEEKIWEYLDGGLDDTSRREIEYAIAHDSYAAALHREAAAVHEMLMAQTAEQPSMAFTQRVMDAVRPVSAPKVSLMPVLVSALPFLILIVLVAAFLLSSGTPVPQPLQGYQSFLNTSFILADVVLFVLFMEELFYMRNGRMA